MRNDQGSVATSICAGAALLLAALSPLQASAASDKAGELSNAQHGTLKPRDAASGLPSGKRTHHPITIGKGIDSASPTLYAANHGVLTGRRIHHPSKHRHGGDASSSR